MGYRLLIAEKPSVATKSYRELLENEEGERFVKKDGYLQGRGYVISWCLGHLVQLASPEDYGWNGWKLENLPMIPDQWRYVIQSEKKKQFKILSGLCQEAEVIINGADAGREGELIVRLVLMMAGATKKPQKRLWLNSFVMKDMITSWRDLKDAASYHPLYQSALSRSRADWLIGMNGTMGYSVGTGQRGLSVGRVQTPTLQLVVTRDQLIDNWKDRHYFQLHALWRDLDFTYDREGKTDFEKEEDLKKVKEKCRGKKTELKEFEKKERKQNPPKPFDLTELQKEANKLFGLKAAATLKLTQELYENKMVTYPRTDSQYLPESMEEEAREILARVAKENEKPCLLSREVKLAFFNSAKVTDHYAIIPTGETGAADRMSENAKRVYELVRSRFVTAFARPYLYEEYRLALECEGEKFKARAIREMEAGFKSLFKKANEEENDEYGNRIKEPLDYRVGERETLNNLNIKKKKATKPSHHTEATLLTAMSTAGREVDDEALREAMKERGLGTPSTKASIIERLKTAAYIVLKGKYLHSTPKGRVLTGIVDPALRSPEMTGEWEYKLQRMAEGKYDIRQFNSEIVRYVKDLKPTYTSLKARNFSNEIAGDGWTCPKCERAKLQMGRKLIKCLDPSCGFLLWTSIAKKRLSESQIKDLISKRRTRRIKGFKSRAGKSFEATLVLDEAFKVKMDFA